MMRFDSPDVHKKVKKMIFKIEKYPSYRLKLIKFTILSVYPDFWLQVKKKCLGITYWSSVWEGAHSIDIQRWNPERLTNHLENCVRSYEEYLSDWNEFKSKK